MLALGEHVHQTLGLEPRQVHARRRRADPAHHAKLGAGAGTAIHQAVEHAGPRRLADRRGDARDGHVGMIDIHTFIVNEV